jgi:hypothetical protein
MTTSVYHTCKVFLSMLGGALVTTTWRVLCCGWRVAANILNRQSQTADKEGSSSLMVGRGP